MSYYDPNQPGRTAPPEIRREPVRRPGSSRPPYPPGKAPTRPTRTTPGRNWGFGCGMFFLGFLLAAVIAGVTVFFLFFYDSVNTANPLARPPAQVGTPDFNATISQTYLNKEIARQLSGSPIKTGPVEIRDMVLKIQDNARIDVDVRASTGPVTFDMTITEQISVQNGQIKLDAVGQPKLLGGQLPPGINAIVDAINNQFVEPQINQQVAQINVNKRPIRLLDISTSPGFIIVKANVV
jgi:hypothetical protein